MILVVEDDSFKYDRIKVLLESVGYTDVKWCQSVHSGVQALSTDEFELIILDMALPSHDLAARGGSPTSLPSGGLELIYELSYAQKAVRLLIITQYPEIEIEGSYVKLTDAPKRLQELYRTPVMRVIQFKQNDSTWEQGLADAMKEIP